MKGRARRATLGLAAIAALLAVQGAPALAREPDTIGEAMAFRASFGLRSDRAFVLSEHADPTASTEYGYALTVKEVAILEGRQALQERAATLLQFIDDSGDAFGGAYFDRSASPSIHVLVVSPMAKESLAGLLPDGLPVEFEAAETGLATLRALQARIDAEHAALWAAGIRVATTKVDIIRNVVVVGVVEKSDDVEAVIRARFGDDVSIVTDELAEPLACNSRSDCGPPTVPLRGGVRISGGGATCTSGYVGKAVAGPTLYVVTAGHCIQASGIGVNWSHHGVNIGPSVSELYFSGTTSDSGTIRILADPTSDNFVYASSAADQRHLTAQYTDAQMPVNTLICRSGQSSGYRCGDVSATNVTKTAGDGTQIAHLWETDFPGGVSGDSGAPMIANSTLGGLISATTSAHGYYSTVARTTTNLGVRPCLASTC